MNVVAFFLLLAVGVLCANAQRKQTVVELESYHRKCQSSMRYRIAKTSAVDVGDFLPYLNATGSSEEDCARQCWERLDFCSAATFMRRQGICLFSFKWIACQDGDKLAEAPRGDERLAHCIRCGGGFTVPAKQPKRNQSLPVVRNRANQLRVSRPRNNPNTTTTTRLRPPFRSGSRSNGNRTVKPKSKLRGRQSSRQPSSKQTTTRRTQKPTTNKRRPTTRRSTPRRTQRPSITRRTTTTASSTRRTTTTTVSSTQTTTQVQNTPIPRPLQINGIESRNASLGDCPIAMMKPCNYGFGRGCTMQMHASGCPVCACPYKSPARGCAGPQGLTDHERIAMLLGQEKCPNGRRMQIVHRWYRKLNTLTKKDECYVVKEPYCGWLQDVNIWRQPRTKDECHYFCYTDEELRARRLVFFRL